MNIMITNNFRKPIVSFGEKSKPPKNETNLPTKLTLTETEEHFYTDLKKLYTLNSNIKTQRQNLKDYYSPQDRFDYTDLLKKRRSIIAKLKREAKKAGTTYENIEYNILLKKEYNRYAPKIVRAKTLKELKSVLELISECAVCGSIELLTNLAKQLKLK